MDCERCRDELPSLLYGELDELRAAGLRRHLDGCARCRTELERLESVRSLVRSAAPDGPSEELDRSLLVAARRRVPTAARAGGGALAAATAEPPPWSRIVSWLGSAAMRPQVAMALLLVLMVGVGLWYLPQARRAAEWMRAEVSSDHDEEQDGTSAAAAADDDAGVGADQPRVGGPRTTDRAQRRWGRRDWNAPAGRAVGGPPGNGRPHGERGPAGLQQQDDEAAERDAGPPAPALGELEPAGGGDAGPRAFDEPIAANLYARAMNHYRAGRYGDAIDELEAVTRRTDAASLVPRAYLNLARSHRAAGNLAVSARTFETLLSRWPGFGQRSQAMWEAAVVYRRLGQLGRARALLERLVDVPTHSARARRELVLVNQGERAAAAAGAGTAISIESGL